MFGIELLQNVGISTTSGNSAYLVDYDILRMIKAKSSVGSPYVFTATCLTES